MFFFGVPPLPKARKAGSEGPGATILGNASEDFYHIDAWASCLLKAIIVSPFEKLFARKSEKVALKNGLSFNK